MGIFGAATGAIGGGGSSGGNGPQFDMKGFMAGGGSPFDIKGAQAYNQNQQQEQAAITKASIGDASTIGNNGTVSSAQMRFLDAQNNGAQAMAPGTNPMAPSPSNGIQELSSRVEALESGQGGGMSGGGSIANLSQPLDQIQNVFKPTGASQVNTPFAPSNEMGFANSNFSPLAQQNANDIFGSGPERDSTMIR